MPDFYCYPGNQEAETGASRIILEQDILSGRSQRTVECFTQLVPTNGRGSILNLFMRLPQQAVGNRMPKDVLSGELIWHTNVLYESRNLSVKMNPPKQQAGSDKMKMSCEFLFRKAVVVILAVVFVHRMKM